MKRMVPVVFLAIILAGSSAWAGDVAATLDVHSAYVWRGITVNDGLVAQPSLDVSKNGFGLNVWGNYDLSSYDNRVDDHDFSEIDLSPYYTFTIADLTLTFGIIDYLFPSSGAEGTVEVFGRAGLPIAGGLSAAAAFYYDADEVQSYYIDLGLTYALPLTDQLTAEAGARLGYAGKDFALYYSSGATDGGLYDYGLSLGLKYAVSEAVSVGASVRYVGSLDKDVLPEADLANGVYGVDTRFFGGVSLSCKF